MQIQEAASTIRETIWDCRGAPVRNLRIVYAAGVARETILGDPWRAQEHEKFILRIQEAPSAPREMIFEWLAARPRSIMSSFRERRKRLLTLEK